MGFILKKPIDEEGNDIYEKSYVDPGKVFKHHLQNLQSSYW
ncbi:MAG: hypothetical protein Ct9H90mP3_5910 [Flammeovirgaceae bacterium]|nr:MAG: hypothetical protein Ct9H90mP3_5910 [Flammeovirgaceae bacterium]